MSRVTLSQIKAEFNAALNEEPMKKSHPLAATSKVLKRATKVKKVMKTERPTKSKR